MEIPHRCLHQAIQIQHGHGFRPIRSISIKKGSHESMQEYAQRWREKVAQVDPPLLEKESKSIL